MNAHSCKAHDSIDPVFSPQKGSHLIRDRLFLQAHALAHQRLEAAYQRMQALLAQEHKEPTVGPQTSLMIRQVRERLIKILCVFLGPHADPRLACVLIDKAPSQFFVPGSPEFSKRLRFEYVNHIFLSRQHQALKNNFCSKGIHALDPALTEQGLPLMNALQACLAEAKAANDKILLAFEGYRKMLFRAHR